MKEKEEKKGEGGDSLNLPRSSDHPLVDWFLRLLKGFAIGVGGILPGISGGAMAVVFGVYGVVLHLLANPFRHFWEQITYLFPVIFGSLLGILASSALISQVFQHYMVQSMSLFLGFVAGTFPSLYREAGKEGRSDHDRRIFLVTALIFAVGMVVLGRQEWPELEGNFFIWMICGAAFGMGIILPGSPSNFMIYLGLYDKIAAGIARLDWSIIVPMIVGLLLCIFLLSKVVERFFRRHYSKTYHFMLGMVLGSTLAILITEVFPVFYQTGLQSGIGKALLDFFSCLLAFGLGGWISYRGSLWEAKYSGGKEEGGNPPVKEGGGK